MTFGARARILPAALSHNLDVARQRAAGCRVMAAVKGNGYGHGLVTAARAFGNADSLAVARLSEALRLRDAGVTLPLVLLSGPGDASERQLAADLGCELVIHGHHQLALMDSGPKAVTWLKVDTGMHRLGFDPAEVSAVADRLAVASGVSELRLMTHFACADDPGDALTGSQVDAFRQLVATFDGAISIANSAALMADDPVTGKGWSNGGDAWVRPGIALYGVSPFAGKTGADFGLQPAMNFDARLVAVKPLAAGERVGYGGHWRASRDTQLGIVAAGYGDGYTRFLPSGTPLLVNGRRVPLAGVVSMDLAAVDLGPDSTDCAGDSVRLWGEGLPVEEVAEAAGTIPYQLLTGVLHREAPLIDA